MDYVSDIKMNMNLVRSAILPWKDKEGNERFYINNVEYLISDYRRATNTELRSYYNWDEMRASGGRVREIIEGNIMPKTKVYVDAKGHVHIYGYAASGVGADIGMPQLITKAVNFVYGYCDEGTRENNKKLIGKSGRESRVGDTVKIVKGRKEVGKVFEVSSVSKYLYNRWADPSVYLFAEDGFKVSGDNCEIVDVGYSF